MSDSAKLVMTVPEYAASRFGISKNAAYFAAANGDIPVVKIGRRIFVPIRLADEKFGLTSKQPEAA